MTTVLVVDDEPAIRRMIRIACEAAGHRVVEADSVRQATVEAAMARPDVILLDLGLPDGDGVAVVRSVRSWSTVPIVVISARDADHAKIDLLDAGADDYVTKPFSMPELLARIRAMLRRAVTVDDPVVVVGRIRIDLVGHTVWRDDSAIHCTATEFALLRILASHLGRVVTHGQLLREVWGPGALDAPQYLRVHVAALRKKLGDAVIRTETGVGYRLVDTADASGVRR